MTYNNSDATNKSVSQYINSILKINREFGFTEEIPQEAIDKARHEIEKVYRKYQKILAHS